MAWFYCKSGATGTGDAGRYATQQTGSFADLGAANYYPSRAAAYAATTPPVAGDFVEVSDASDHNYGANTTITMPDGVIYRSVSDTAIDTYSAGATERTTGAPYDLIHTSNSGRVNIIDGFNFICEDDFILGQASALIHHRNCTLQLSGTSTNDRMFVGESDGATTVFEGCDFTFQNSTQRIMAQYGSITHINGGSLTTSQTVFIENNGAGGCQLFFDNFDASASTGAIAKCDVAGDDAFSLVMNRCKLNASASLLMAAPGYPGHTADAYSCDTGDGYYANRHERYEGVAFTQTSVYRSGGATYDGSTNFAYEFQPTANVLPYYRPLEIRIKDFELDLTSANTVSFHLAFGDNDSAITALTDVEAWIKIVQNDATDQALGVSVDSRPSDALSAGTTLTASTETWSGLTHTNTDKRQISVTTNVVTGMTNGQVTAYLCIAKYVSTMEIFCCPDPVIT